MSGKDILVLLAIGLIMFNLIAIATGAGSELSIAALLIAVFVFVSALSRERQ